MRLKYAEATVYPRLASPRVDGAEPVVLVDKAVGTTSSEGLFTEIVPGEPLRWGFKRKRGSQI